MSVAQQLKDLRGDVRTLLEFAQVRIHTRSTYALYSYILRDVFTDAENRKRQPTKCFERLRHLSEEQRARKGGQV